MMPELTDEEKKVLSPEEQHVLLEMLREDEAREARAPEIYRCPFCKEMKPARLSPTSACTDCMDLTTNEIGERLFVNNNEQRGFTIYNTVTKQPHEGNKVWIRTKIGRAPGIGSGGVAVEFIA